MEDKISYDGKQKLNQAEEYHEDHQLFHQHLENRINWSHHWQESQLDKTFQNIGKIYDQQEILIINIVSKFCPAIKVLKRQSFLTWSTDESIPSVNFVNDGNINHPHNHNPEVKNILKEHKLSHSFVLGSVNSFKDVHEGEHPSSIHQECYKHCSLFKSVDVVNPFPIVEFIYVSLFCIETQNAIVLFIQERLCD